MTGKCIFEDCEIIAVIIRGWCPKHYSRWRKYGNPAIAEERGKYNRTDKHKRAQSLRRRTGSVIECANCNKQIYRRPFEIRKWNFCSTFCYHQSPEVKRNLSEKHKGKVKKVETKEKLKKIIDKSNTKWKGEKPRCKDCGKGICYDSTYCNSCKASHWTKEHLRKRGKSASKSLAGKMPKNINREGLFGNVKRGWFEIEGKRLFFRSKWEASYYLYLNFLIKENQIKTFSYEEDIFTFENVEDGINSYCPDFKVVNLDNSIEYHEVKGWLTPRGNSQLEKMRVFFPQIKLNLIDAVRYQELKRKYGKSLNFY